MYSEDTKLLYLKGLVRKKTIILTNKLNFSISSNYIKITPYNFYLPSKNVKKKTKSYLGLICSIIKQSVLEVSNILCKKLKFVGVGFKVFIHTIFNKIILQLKIGFSHTVFLKLPSNIKVHCFKSNSKIYLFGTNYRKLLQITSFIRKLKIPEPYKGKGILYELENIKLKEGKKI